MARVLKKAEDRRHGVLDTAEELFIQKGYAQTTISDILEHIDIARGTLYYHFASKEEILEGILDRAIDLMLSHIHAAIDGQVLNALDRFQLAVTAQMQYTLAEQSKILRIHQIHDAHQRIIIKSIQRYTPIFAEILQQGVQEGLFDLACPTEIVEYFGMAQFLLDPGLFPSTRAQFYSRIAAMETMMERTLQIETGRFHFLTELFTEYFERFYPEDGSFGNSSNF